MAKKAGASTRKTAGGGMRPAVEIMLDVLRDEGVSHIFGNPGSTEMPLMDALVDAPDITYVLGLQEATAAGMADGYALATGRASFLNLHAMGGLGNAMGVLVASKASETPMVVTAGQQDTRHLFSDPWLAGDLVSLAEPVTKWAAEVRRGADLAPALRRAFAIARTPPQGPVFLSLPMDVLGETLSGAAPPRSAEPRPAPGGGFSELAEALAAHDPARVVVLIGDDVPADAAPGAQALARAGGFQVYGTQLTSRAAFPASDPCWGGMLKPDFALIRQRLEGMEAVLLIGGRAFVAYPYRDVRPIPDGTRFYHLSSAAEAFGREHPADRAVLGDLATTLEAVAAEVGKRVDARAVAKRLDALGAAKAKRLVEVRAAIEGGAATRPMTADAAVLAVMDALPRETLIANEASATFGAVQEIMQTEAGRYFFARGGVLGCAMPAAVGASFAHDGPVAYFGGDGGAMYSPQALWTAAHHKRQVLFVVFNNTRYQVLMNVAKGLEAPNALAGRFVGMDLVAPAIDYQGLARSLGVAASQPTSREAVAAAVAEAVARDGPTLIEIPIA
jgi:benzoylformate decarboxylase